MLLTLRTSAVTLHQRSTRQSQRHGSWQLEFAASLIHLQTRGIACLLGLCQAAVQAGCARQMV